MVRSPLPSRLLSRYATTTAAGPSGATPLECPSSGTSERARDLDYPAQLRELVELFELLDDRSERIQTLIDTADRFQEVPEDVAKRPFEEAHKVPACESEVFVWGHSP